MSFISYLCSKITKNQELTKQDQMEIVSGLIIKDIERGYNIFNTGWGSDFLNVGDALAAIKQLIYGSFIYCKFGKIISIFLKKVLNFWSKYIIIIV